MKYKYNGQWVDVNIKALDSMPVGTMVDYDGEDIPTGWEEVNDYSTTEIDTGKKWIDGKPIYRKVIEGTTPSSAGAWGDIGTIPTSTLISMTGILGGYLPVPCFVNSSYLCALQKSGTNIQVYTMGYTNTAIKVIVEYTK